MKDKLNLLAKLWLLFFVVLVYITTWTVNNYPSPDLLGIIVLAINILAFVVLFCGNGKNEEEVELISEKSEEK